MKDEYIYRDLELPRTSINQAGKLIQDLIICDGSITSMCKLTNSFPESKVTYWSTIYRIKFPDRGSLEKFESKGWVTSDVPKKAVARLANDDE